MKLATTTRACRGKETATGPAKEGEARGQVQVQVLYEDRETGLRAKRVVDGLAQHFGAEVEIGVSLWRFDLLDEPALRTEVANAAMGADVLLLSAHGQHGLPEAVKLWLTGWLSQPVDEPPALAVLLDSLTNADLTWQKVLAPLEASAAQAGVQLFFKFVEQTKPGDLTFEQIQRRAETTTRVLADTLRAPSAYLHRHWGLNE